MSNIIYPTSAQEDGKPFRKIVAYKADLEVKAGERCVIAAISTDSIDRSNEVVIPRGIEKDTYRKNPVVLWAHDYRILPIGKSLWVKNSRDGRQLISKTQFNNTELGEQVFNLFQRGDMSAFSIGFIAKEYSAPTLKEIELRPELEGCRLIIRKSSLLEYSAVPVPCNPDALALEISKGLVVPKEMEEVLKSKVYNVPVDFTIKSTELNDENVEEVDKCSDVEPVVEAVDLTEKSVEETKDEIVEEVKEIKEVEEAKEETKVDVVSELSAKLEKTVKTLEFVMKKLDIVDKAKCSCNDSKKCSKCLGTGKCVDCFGTSKCGKCMGKGSCEQCDDGDCNHCADGKCVKCAGNGKCRKCSGKAEEAVEVKEVAADPIVEAVEPVVEKIIEPPIVPYRTVKDVQEQIKKRLSSYDFTVSDEEIKRMAKEDEDRRLGRV